VMSAVAELEECSTR